MTVVFIKVIFFITKLLSIPFSWGTNIVQIYITGN